MTDTSRQQNRKRERELEKLKETVTKLCEQQTVKARIKVFNLLIAALDKTKLPERFKLEEKALSVLMARGNLSDSFLYFQIIQGLPDLILAYDPMRLYKYVYLQAQEKQFAQGVFG